MEPIDVSSVAAWPFVQAGLTASLFLILLAQPGFMLFVAGAGSRKNVIAAIYRSLAGASIAALVFLLFGHDILSGEGPVIEQLRRLGLALAPAAAGEPPLRPGDALAPLLATGSALIAYAIAAAATAGRATPLASAIFAAFFAGLVYPVAAFTLINPAGLLYEALPNFAGAASVHLVGAGAALAGAVMLGPRLGFNGYDPINLGQDRLFRVAASHAPHHAPMTAQGAFLIWLGLVGVAIGALFSDIALRLDALSADGLGGAALSIESRFAGMLTALILAPIGGVLAMAAAQSLLRRDLEILDLLIGAIAGLAALASSAASAGPEMAFILGAVAALAVRLARGLIASLSIDDPIGAVSTHGMAAIVGLTLGGLARGVDSLDAAEAGERGAYALGLFAATFIVSIVLYKATELLCKVIVVLLRRATFREALRGNQLRVDYEAEIFGLDETRHGQDAYTFRPSR